MSLTKPTREEYENALKDKKMLNEWLSMEYKTRDELLDKLLNSRETIKMYQEALNQSKDIIQRYEIYQEVEQNFRNER